MQRERAVIAEAVERAAAGDLAGEAPILALIEERAGLLPAPGRGEVSHPVLLTLDPFGDGAAQELDADRQLSFARSATSLRARMPVG